MPVGRIAAHCRAGLEAYRAGHPFVLFPPRVNARCSDEPETRHRQESLVPQPCQHNISLLGQLGHIAQFATRTLGPLSTAVDRSWTRLTTPPFSRVWQVAGLAGSSWYIKQHPTPEFHDREVRAYRRWIPLLGPHRAPELIAADRNALAVVLSCWPGRPAAADRTIDARDQITIHRQAGQLIRRLHDIEPAQASVGVAERVQAKAERSLRLCRGVLARRDADMAGHLIGELADIELPIVPTHGDNQDRNWLWDARRRRLALIDFERADYGWAVRDFVRLECGSWDDRTDLKASFFAGYGRSLSETEEIALGGLTASKALDNLQWALHNDDHDTFVQAQRILRHLLKNRLWCSMW